MNALIGYRRLSHEGGEGSLGLAAQTSAIEAYAQRHGGELVHTYTDDGLSGADDSRPELALALAHSKRIGGTVVVAKIDRLARSTRKALAVIDDYSVVACDIGADPFMLGLMSLFAQKELETISGRIRAALQQRKARGFTLGRIENLVATRGVGAAVLKERAKVRAESVREVVMRTYAETGSYRACALLLDKWQVGGRRWHGQTVARTLAALDTGSKSRDLSAPYLD